MVEVGDAAMRHGFPKRFWFAVVLLTGRWLREGQCTKRFSEALASGLTRCARFPDGD